MMAALKMRELYHKYHYFEHCTVDIFIDQTKLDNYEILTLESLQIEETTSVKSSVAYLNMSVEDYTSEIKKTLQIGAKMLIKAGYEKNKQIVFCGFIEELIIRKTEDKQMKVDIIGMDVLALMTMGNHYAQKDQKTIHMILDDISKRSVYKKYISKIEMPSVSQSNNQLIPIYLKSDFEMLKEICSYFHFETFIVKETLYIGKFQQYTFDTLYLEDDLGVYETQLDCSVSSLAQEIEVVSFDFNGKQLSKKKKLSYTSFPVSSQVTSLMKEKTQRIVIGGVNEMAGLDIFIDGYSQKMLNQYGEISITTVFLPELTCGMTVEFTLANQKLKCYVTSVHHYLLDEMKTRIRGCCL